MTRERCDLKSLPILNGIAEIPVKTAAAPAYLRGRGV
jgi:hypothetical protein